MKNIIKTGIYFFAIFVTLLCSECQKNPGDLKPTPPLDTAIINSMYPASLSTYQGTQSSNATGYKYTYDKDNHLLNYVSFDSNVVNNVGPNQVDQIVKQFTTDNTGHLVLYHISTTSFVYTLVGLPNTSVNIYNSAPTQVTYTHFEKDVGSGLTQTTPGGQWQFENNQAGLPTKEISSDGVGFNFNFTYDSNGNLKMVAFVHLSGPRANAVYGRLTVTSLDNKPSPFSAVKGYWAASYPQGYLSDYAWSFCKNNPIQIISERYDLTSNTFIVDEQDNFSYIYNDKGYPTQIVINATYFAGTTTQGVTTYNLTYK